MGSRPIPPPGGWARDPIRFDAERFLREGVVTVGSNPIRAGVDREQVRALVPAPQNWTLTSDGSESDGWSWGGFELMFLPTGVCLYSDHLDMADDDAELTVDQWFLREGMPARELRRELSEAAIPYRAFSSEDRLRGLLHLPESGVWLHLESAAWEPVHLDRLAVMALTTGGPTITAGMSPVDLG